MNPRQPLVAGNWKLNGSRSSVKALATALVDGVSDVTCDVLVCPSFVHIQDVQSVVANSAIKLGSQNCSTQSSGAFTGEVAAEMLQEFGCSHIIVGHSERRQLFGESDAVVAEKAAAVQNAGLIPIICIGETLEEREAGNWQSVMSAQLDAVIAVIGIDAFANAVIAYEPVWAIGTGKSASSEQAQEVHAMLRSKLADLSSSVAASVKILYGGSVKPANAKELFSQPDIDGGLIGGAALNADDFLAICRAAG